MRAVDDFCNCLIFEIEITDKTVSTRWAFTVIIGPTVTAAASTTNSALTRDAIAKRDYAVYYVSSLKLKRAIQERKVTS